MREIADAVATVIAASKGMARVEAGWVAHGAMQLVDPDRVSLPSVYWGCNEYAKQVAMLQLRGKFVTNIAITDQHEMFPELQVRYPAKPKKGVEPYYIKLELMTEDDVNYNISRLRKEAQTKLAHADALADWWVRKNASAA